MNSKIKDVIESILTFLLGLQQKNKHSAVLLSPPIPETNLGDQALLLGAIEGISKQGYKKVLIINNSYKESVSRAIEQCNLDHINIEIEVDESLATAFFSILCYRERLKLYYKIRKYSYMLMIGADTVDGTYESNSSEVRKKIAPHLSRMGINLSLSSFSLSKNISNVSKESLIAISEHTHFVTRDVYSYERLTQIVDKAELASDLAFQMTPNSEIDIARSEQKNYVGLCLKNTDVENNEEKWIFKLIKLAIENNIVYVHLPHHPQDFEISKTLHQEFIKINKSISIMPFKSFPNCQQIKKLSSGMDLVLTGRMHVGIAAISQSIPIFCKGYLNKFEGLLRHFDLDEQRYMVNLDDFDIKIIKFLNEDNVLSFGSERFVDVKGMSLKNILVC